jgi:hypothetical protein
MKQKSNPNSKIKSGTKDLVWIWWTLFLIQNVICAFSAQPVSSLYDEEDKEKAVVQKGVDDVSNIRPLIWRYKMRDLKRDETVVCAIQIPEIEFVSLHDYIVDGKLDVTECSVAMKSKMFVRFYYTEGIQLGGRVGEKARDAHQKTEDRSTTILKQPSVVPGMPSEQDSASTDKRVVKNYPATTHHEMIEYRLKEKVQIHLIYRSIEMAFVEFKAFPFTIELRQNTLRGIEFQSEKLVEETNRSASDPAPKFPYPVERKLPF